MSPHLPHPNQGLTVKQELIGDSNPGLGDSRDHTPAHHPVPLPCLSIKVQRWLGLAAQNPPWLPTALAGSLPGNQNPHDLLSVPPAPLTPLFLHSPEASLKQSAKSIYGEFRGQETLGQEKLGLRDEVTEDPNPWV